MHSSSERSAANLSHTTVRVSSVGTLMNRLTTSKLTIWNEWMGVLLIFYSKWQEFLIYYENLLVSGMTISTRKWLNGWHTEPLLLIMGLNRIPSLWMLGRPYMCGSLLWCCVSCLYFICCKRSLFLLRICDSFVSIFWFESFFFTL